MPFQDPAKSKEYRRSWRAKNREKVLEQKRRARERKALLNPKPPGLSLSQKQRYKNRDLKRQGWTLEMVESTSVEQGGRCMICRQTPKPKSPKGGTGGLCADHAHTVPPKPRALLCHNCNAGLGQFRESPELLRAAAEYLEAWA